MAKKDQESQEKQVLTEWQKRNLEFLRKKKKPKILKNLANGKVVHSEEATSNESQPPVKKKVKKKKRPKGRNEKKGTQLVIFQLHNKNLAGLVVLSLHS